MCCPRVCLIIKVPLYVLSQGVSDYQGPAMWGLTEIVPIVLTSKYVVLQFVFKTLMFWINFICTTN